MTYVKAADIASNQPDRPAWALRALAIGAFVGLVPLIWLLPSRKRSTFLDRQCAQAAVLFLILAGIDIIFACITLFVSYLLVAHRTTYENWPIERIALDVEGTLLLLWCIAWLIGVVRALFGSIVGIPYLTRLRDRPWAVRAGLVVVVAAYTVVAVIAGLTASASRLVHHDVRPAQAYMLFDDLGWVPHWVFDLGFYRIARAAHDNWGPDSVVVTPFTAGAFQSALDQGVFVFLSSHGTEEGLYTRDRWYTPEDAVRAGHGPQLAYVYITGCDSGVHARGWERALAPARVTTFNRLSAIIEHVYWLWFRGPVVIDGLASSSSSHDENQHAPSRATDGIPSTDE